MFANCYEIKRKATQLTYKLKETTHKKEVPGDQKSYMVTDLPAETRISIAISVVYHGSTGEHSSEVKLVEGKAFIFQFIFT